MSKQIMKTITAGLAGGMASNIAMLLTFRTIGFGWDGKGILIESPIQSQKLIAVWTQIEPLPKVVTNPAPIIIGILLLGIIHAWLYRMVSSGWPSGMSARTVRFAGLIFLMTYLFWEFFTPFNQFGEPVILICLELVFWACIASAEAAAIVWMMEKDRGSI